MKKLLILGKKFDILIEDENYLKEIYSIIHFDDNINYKYDPTIYTEILYNCSIKDYKKIKKYKNTFHIFNFYEKILKKVYLSWEKNTDVETYIKDMKTKVYVHSFYKKILDYFLILILLPIILPIMFFVSLYIITITKSNPIFKQIRIGFNQKQFYCYKFKTMYDDISLENRFFKGAKLIRKLRFDELPQIVNVLKGEMSMIGPRAEWNQLTQKYEKQLNFYHLRHQIKPGISGWAQVEYKHTSEDEEIIHKTMYDFYYLKYNSLFLDFLIIFKTIKTILSAAGK